MRCEVLTDPDMAGRGRVMLEAMIRAAPMECKVRNHYRGDCELLMVYGSGHPVRRPWQLKHLKRGGRLIAWDLGYWHRRVGESFTMRLSIDADHPHAMLRPESPERWAAAGIALRQDADARGPVIIVGMSAKANRMNATGRMSWELRALREVYKNFPGRRVLFRPKRLTDGRLSDIPTASGDIEQVLRGASLVRCHHSNVAVDACIAGVPVVCDDGAALALYRKGSDPTPAERLAFLQSLAHWQYSPHEAAIAWNYIQTRL